MSADSELEQLRAERDALKAERDAGQKCITSLQAVLDELTAAADGVASTWASDQAERDALKATEQRVREFADYISTWSAEHDSEVTEHEIETMRTAARELRRTLDGEL